jgi:hypothetical protein
MANKAQAKPRSHELEVRYTELIRILKQYPVIIPTYSGNLAQPSTLRIVDSVTTYGAYQTPV